MCLVFWWTLSRSGKKTPEIYQSESVPLPKLVVGANCTLSVPDRFQQGNWSHQYKRIIKVSISFVLGHVIRRGGLKFGQPWPSGNAPGQDRVQGVQMLAIHDIYRFYTVHFCIIDETNGRPGEVLSLGVCKSNSPIFHLNAKAKTQVLEMILHQHIKDKNHENMVDTIVGWSRDSRLYWSFSFQNIQDSEPSRGVRLLICTDFDDVEHKHRPTWQAWTLVNIKMRYSRPTKTFQIPMEPSIGKTLLLDAHDLANVWIHKVPVVIFSCQMRSGKLPYLCVGWFRVKWNLAKIEWSFFSGDLTVLFRF